MRTFIRRTLIIAALLLGLYYLYAWINPTGAGKISTILSGIQMPWNKSEPSLEINEVGQQTSDPILLTGGVEQTASPPTVVVEPVQPSAQQPVQDADQPTLVQPVQEVAEPADTDAPSTDTDTVDRREYLEDEQTVGEQQLPGASDPVVKPNADKPATADDVPQQKQTIDLGTATDDISDAELKEIQELLNNLLE